MHNWKDDYAFWLFLFDGLVDSYFSLDHRQMNWMTDMTQICASWQKMHIFPLSAVQIASRLHCALSSLIITHFEVYDLWWHDRLKWLLCLNTGWHITLQVSQGTFLGAWSCLFLSLFVSHYCLAPPAAHSQWEPGSGRSSPSSPSFPPSSLFCLVPAPFLCVKTSLEERPFLPLVLTSSIVFQG